MCDIYCRKHVRSYPITILYRTRSLRSYSLRLEPILDSQQISYRTFAQLYFESVPKLTSKEMRICHRPIERFEYSIPLILFT